MTLGKGRAAALGPNDFAIIADELQCHPADLEAIALAESAGFGWFDDGRMKILPEPHIFRKYLPKAKRASALKSGLATTSYKVTKASGHYKRMTTRPGPRYDFFQRMIDFDRDAAMKAASYGTYQIMGFNHAICGFASAEAMFNAFLDSEANQLRAFVAFLRNKKLVVAIRKGDFNLVEERYNGGGQGGAYAREMRKHAALLRKGKWKGYTAGDRKPEAAKPSKPAERVPAPSTPKDTAPAPQSQPTATQGGKGGIVAIIIAAVVAAGAAIANWFCSIPIINTFCGG